MSLLGGDLEKVKWDAMHVVNLGIDLWVAASAFLELLEYECMWGGSSLAADRRLAIATQEFRVWARMHKWQHFAYHNIICSGARCLLLARFPKCFHNQGGKAS